MLHYPQKTPMRQGVKELTKEITSHFSFLERKRLDNRIALNVNKKISSTLRLDNRIALSLFHATLFFP